MRIKVIENKVGFKFDKNNKLIGDKTFKKGEFLNVEKIPEGIKIIDENEEEYIIFDAQVFINNNHVYETKNIETSLQLTINKRINQLKDMCIALGRDLKTTINQDIRLEVIVNDFNFWYNVI